MVQWLRECGHETVHISVKALWSSSKGYTSMKLSITGKTEGDNMCTALSCFGTLSMCYLSSLTGVAQLVH